MVIERAGQGSGPPRGGSAAVADPLLAEAVRRLVDALRPEQIYLFGSRGRGDSREDSDYDFMVVVQDSDVPPHRRAQLAHLALRDVRVAADILVWTRQEFDHFLPVAGSLAATILREGRLLYDA
jgi:predicted nucleotidyltransferase